MNTITRLGFAGALAGMVAFGGCSTTNSMLGRNQQVWTMTSEPVMPSAIGRVQVATGDKGNRDLRVEASHLAKPDSKFDGASTYVVWLKPSQGHPVNIGVLTPDKNENAKLETTTPFTTFEVMVTAEASPQPTSPSSHEVLSTMVHVAT
jgi:hypothetical protein